MKSCRILILASEIRWPSVLIQPRPRYRSGDQHEEDSAFVAILLACTPAFAADVNGKWKADFETQIGTQHYTYEFHVDGTKLTGKAKNDQGETELKEGKIDGDTISFAEDISYEGNEIHIVYTGKISGDVINFSRQVGSYATESLVAKRAK